MCSEITLRKKLIRNKGKKILLYKINKISDALFTISESVFGESFPLFIYVVVGSERAALIDTGLGCDDLLEAVRTITNLPLIVLHTHAHVDHVGADSQFETIYLAEKERTLTGNGYDAAKSKEDRLAFIKPLIGGNTDLYNYISVHMLDSRPVNAPYNNIKDGDIIDLGGIRLEAVFTPGHTPYSLSYVEQTHRFAFTGDSIADIHWFDIPGITVKKFCGTLDHFIENAESSKQIFAAHLPDAFTMQLVYDLQKTADEIVAGSDDPVVNADYQFLKHGMLHVHRVGQATIYYADNLRF